MVRRKIGIPKKSENLLFVFFEPLREENTFPCNQSALLVQNAKRENSAKNFFLKISSFISSANLLTGQEHYDTTVID